jgi:hypothetical protein
VAVTIEGGGPCASEYKVVGDHLAVLTVSHAEGTVKGIGARVDAALQSLFGSLASNCRSPDDVAGEARRRLADVGLSDVTVRVIGDGPCTSGSWESDAEKRTVTIEAPEDPSTRGVLHSP